jgi:predicted acyltransferase
METSTATTTSAPGGRITSMDQFRGLTILLMFVVHYSGGSDWGVNFRPVLGHNHYYLSVGDLAFPWFHLAAGFALRLSLLRRLQTGGAWAAYGRTVRRCLLLVLLADVELLLGGLHVSRWGPLQDTGPLGLLATCVKFDGWRILAIIGVTSLWVLPVIGKSVRVRVGYLIGGLLLHALATQTFYMACMNGRPNPVDSFLGTTGVHGHEGGPLGFLVWAVPQLAGSFVYDLVTRQSPGRASRWLLSSGIFLAVLGYGLGSLSSLYPLAEGQPLAEWLYPETEQPTESPVLPRFTDHSARDWGAYFADPPFVPPPAERIRLWNYWMLSRRLATPTFMLTAIGFGLMGYAAFVWLCDAGTFRLGVLRTLGLNPLIAYLLDGIGGAVSDGWSEGGGRPWALAGVAVRFGVAYVPVRLLEWRRIYLRL